MAKTRRRNKTKNKTYTKKDYESGDGMVTRIWGPWAWCFLHTISFNYPAHPTKEQKKQYRDFILSLQHVLPCGHCRKNLTKNLKKHPLTMRDMKSRETFSRWLYALHEMVNKLLNKNSNLTYEQVRDRYEHFRSRCTQNSHKTKKKYKKCVHRNAHKKTRKKEKGCTTPLNGKKSKCIIKIVPLEKKCKTFQMDKKCIKKRV